VLEIHDLAALIRWFAAVEVHGIVLCRLNNLKIYAALRNCSVLRNTDHVMTFRKPAG